MAILLKKLPIAMESLRPMQAKADLRSYFLTLRSKLPTQYRSHAASALHQTLRNDILPYQNVLSFCPFKSEIDISPINQLLTSLNRLFLPRIFGQTLRIFKIGDLNADLECNSFGLLEPKISCPEMPAQQLNLILVPFLAFDSNNHRLGYGKGYYDRLLNSISSIPAWGIGFKEQYYPKLSIHSEDIPLTKVFAF